MTMLLSFGRSALLAGMPTVLAVLSLSAVRATRSAQCQYQVRLAAMRNLDPFHFRHLPAAVFSSARQHRNPQAAYCRSLDRLHLAAMEELKLRRLITLDEIQGKAAEALDYEVLYPGRE